ncbi:substrate-binding domain-containing protein [Victivallis vadensis]|uniref:substrate-binding domain-containing protein n=1 Tax=Victivallis vadensis TaxID=172901 RepID=UPI0026DD7C22|nr:substrate-binding domain-containing protein [Victivallis vadensis]
MAPQLKYVQIAEQLKRRIENGDYNFCAMPGVPKLAAEIGVSYLTARQAVQKLIADGVLRRADNSRLEICNHPGSRRNSFKVAFIHPLNVTSDSVWRNAICKTAGEFECSFREIVYCHNDDPLLYDGLDGGFDLIFLRFDGADPLFLEKLKKQSDRLVTLFHDLTRYGIRCLDGLNPAAIDDLIRYLYECGHRRIDCLNTQPASSTVDARIAQWRASLKKYGCTGRLHNDPVAPFVWSMPHAYDVLNGVIARGELDADALFCLTTPIARAALRCFHEHAIRVPEDISVVSWGETEEARMAIPSLTTVDTPDPAPLVRQIFEHDLGIRPQPGRLLYRTAASNVILAGESVQERNLTNHPSK